MTFGDGDERIFIHVRKVDNEFIKGDSFYFVYILWLHSDPSRVYPELLESLFIRIQQHLRHVFVQPWFGHTGECYLDIFGEFIDTSLECFELHDDVSLAFSVLVDEDCLRTELAHVLAPYPCGNLNVSH